jgi:uncharacterized protein YndB with AHSA1/START domain
MQTPAADSGRTLEKALFIRATPQRVFRALTEPAELEQWFVNKAEVDLRPGGALKFTWREGEVAEGVFLLVDPPHRLSFRWRMRDHRGETTVSIELTPQREGTQVRLVETGWGGDEDWDRLYNAVDAGLSFFFERLVDWLEEGREGERL